MGVEIRQPLTSSRRKLEAALAQVAAPSMHQLQLQRGGGTLLYEVVAVAARDVMRAQTGRKALIVISDGVDTGSEVPLSTAVEEAQRADTLVYSIVFSDANAYGTVLGPMFGGGGPDGKGVLMRISRETGGRCFEVSKTVSIAQIYRDLQQELRSQYNLGFVSDVPVRISGFRRLQLTAKANVPGRPVPIPLLGPALKSPLSPCPQSFLSHPLRVFLSASAPPRQVASLGVQSPRRLLE